VTLKTIVLVRRRVAVVLVAVCWGRRVLGSRRQSLSTLHQLPTVRRPLCGRL